MSPHFPDRLPLLDERRSTWAPAPFQACATFGVMMVSSAPCGTADSTNAVSDRADRDPLIYGLGRYATCCFMRRFE